MGHTQGLLCYCTTSDKKQVPYYLNQRGRGRSIRTICGSGAVVVPIKTSTGTSGYGSIKSAGGARVETAHHSFLGCTKSDRLVGKHINTKREQEMGTIKRTDKK